MKILKFNFESSDQILNFMKFFSSFVKKSFRKKEFGNLFHEICIYDIWRKRKVHLFMNKCA